MLFQVLLYRGSHVPKSNYVPLVRSLEGRLSDINATVRVEDYSMWRRNTFSEDVVLVGHSFGGYFSLLDALHSQETKQNHIQGVVLLNSHFNSRRTALYPSVSQPNVRLPVLVMAGGMDKRLPLSHVLSDLWETLDDRLPNKFYHVDVDHDHFSGLTGVADASTERIARTIEVFVRGIRKNNMNGVQEMCKPSEVRYGYLPIAVPKATDLNNSVDLIDGLLRIVLERFFWNWMHHIAFLMMTPSVYQNFMFTDYGDHILVKACNLSLDEVLRLCQASLPGMYKAEWDVVKVPPNVFGLYLWLLMPLSLRNINTPTLSWPILHLHVKENVDYYKILHPRQIILQSLRLDLLLE